MGRSSIRRASARCSRPKSTIRARIVGPSRRPRRTRGCTTRWRFCCPTAGCCRQAATRTQTAWLPPDPNEEERLEIFSPPYLFRDGPRPAVTAPASATYGEDIQITTTAPITTASLIAPGLTTHSFNSTQRLVDLPFVTPRPNALVATVPTDRRVLPPGWYMLFVVDTRGVPSLGAWIRIA